MVVVGWGTKGEKLRLRHGRRKVNASGSRGLSVAILGMERLDSFCIAMVMSLKASVMRSRGLVWFGVVWLHHFLDWLLVLTKPWFLV